MTPRRTEQPVVSKVKEPFLSKQKRTQIVLVVVFAIVFMVIGALAKDSIVSAMPSRQGIETQSVEGIFIDVNGDGLVDLVVYADVVMNDGNLNLSLGQ